MEMLVLGKIMDAGLEEDEHKLHGDGYVNFVEWCMPHEASNPQTKKRLIAASKDKIISDLLKEDNVVVVNLSPYDLVGHIVVHKKVSTSNPKGAGGAEKDDDKGEEADDHKEFRIKQYDHITFHKEPKPPADLKRAELATWQPK
jgi:hypothetical protein